MAGAGAAVAAELLYGEWAAGVHEVCTAILDRATCKFCWSADGRVQPISESRTGPRPPFHGHCRCTMVTIYLPEAGARKIAGAQIDYAELKADIRDYMRTAQVSLGRGIRHANSYIRETLQTTSPEALTRRLMDRRGYFPRASGGGGGQGTFAFAKAAKPAAKIVRIPNRVLSMWHAEHGASPMEGPKLARFIRKHVDKLSTPVALELRSRLATRATKAALVAGAELLELTTKPGK